MKVPPIPRSLLPDSMAVRVPADSGWGGAHEEEPVQVGHVRFEDASSLKVRDYALSDGSAGVVFVDARNSEGAFEVPKNSLVSINGGPEMVVVKNPAKRAFAEVHHWELEIR